MIEKEGGYIQDRRDRSFCRYELLFLFLISLSFFCRPNGKGADLSSSANGHVVATTRSGSGSRSKSEKKKSEGIPELFAHTHNNLGDKTWVAYLPTFSSNPPRKKISLA